MKESVIYQDIWQQSRKQEALSLIFRLLNRRFGNLSPSVMETVQALSSERLEDLGEALLDFSEIADLVRWLETNENSSLKG